MGDVWEDPQLPSRCDAGSHGSPRTARSRRGRGRRAPERRGCLGSCSRTSSCHGRRPWPPCPRLCQLQPSSRLLAHSQQRLGRLCREEQRCTPGGALQWGQHPGPSGQVGRQEGQGRWSTELATSHRTWQPLGGGCSLADPGRPPSPRARGGGVHTTARLPSHRDPGPLPTCPLSPLLPAMTGSTPWSLWVRGAPWEHETGPGRPGARVCGPCLPGMEGSLVQGCGLAGPEQGRSRREGRARLSGAPRTAGRAGSCQEACAVPGRPPRALSLWDRGLRGPGRRVCCQPGSCARCSLLL